MSTYRVFDAFDFHARHSADRPLVEDDQGILSYGAAEQQIRRLLNGFARLGLSHGDRIAVISKNRAELVLLLLAALKGGPVVVPVNHRLSADEMAWIIHDSQSRLVIAEAEFIDALMPRLGSEVDAGGRFCLGGDRPGWPSLTAWLSDQDAAAVFPPPVVNTAYLQVYTSGTTGRPKGVVLTEANCLGQQLGLQAAADVAFLPGDTLYQALPLFHVGGIFVTLWALGHGSTLLLRRDFSPVVADELIAGRATHAALVPAMISACLGLPPGTYPHLRAVIYGASPISEAVLRSAMARYGADFMQIYGMTETHSVISMMGAREHRQALMAESSPLLGSAGCPIAGTEVVIRNEQGEALEQGVVGEVTVRAQQVMAGYWQNPDATEEALRDGWLYTGDAGYLDAEGYLHIVDRIKDIVVSGGENIASREVEVALSRHPQVADVAVIGIPDPRWGEAVAALVVPAPGADFDPAVLLAHCREHLAGFKVPRMIEAINELPRNGAGKVLKARLRDAYWGSTKRRVG